MRTSDVPVSTVEQVTEALTLADSVKDHAVFNPLAENRGANCWKFFRTLKAGEEITKEIGNRQIEYDIACLLCFAPTRETLGVKESLTQSVLRARATSNLRRHLETKHALVLDISILPNDVRSAMKGPKTPSVSLKRGIPRGSSGDSRHVYVQYVDETIPKSDQRQNKVASLAFGWAVANDVPMDAINHPQFSELMRAASHLRKDEAAAMDSACLNAHLSSSKQQFHKVVGEYLQASKKIYRPADSSSSTSASSSTPNDSTIPSPAWAVLQHSGMVGNDGHEAPMQLSLRWTDPRLFKQHQVTFTVVANPIEAFGVEGSESVRAVIALLAPLGVQLSDIRSVGNNNSVEVALLRMYSPENSGCVVRLGSMVLHNAFGNFCNGSTMSASDKQVTSRNFFSGMKLLRCVRALVDDALSKRPPARNPNNAAVVSINSGEKAALSQLYTDSNAQLGVPTLRVPSDRPGDIVSTVHMLKGMLRSMCAVKHWERRMFDEVAMDTSNSEIEELSKMFPTESEWASIAELVSLCDPLVELISQLKDFAALTSMPKTKNQQRGNLVPPSAGTIWLHVLVAWERTLRPATDVVETNALHNDFWPPSVPFTELHTVPVSMGRSSTSSGLMRGALPDTLAMRERLMLEIPARFNVLSQSRDVLLSMACNPIMATLGIPAIADLERSIGAHVDHVRSNTATASSSSVRQNQNTGGGGTHGDGQLLKPNSNSWEHAMALLEEEVRTESLVFEYERRMRAAPQEGVHMEVEETRNEQQNHSSTGLNFNSDSDVDDDDDEDDDDNEAASLNIHNQTTPHKRMRTEGSYNNQNMFLGAGLGAQGQGHRQAGSGGDESNGADIHVRASARAADEIFRWKKLDVHWLDVTKKIVSKRNRAGVRWEFLQRASARRVPLEAAIEVSRNLDALQWFRQNQNEFPVIARIAMRYASTPVSCVFEETVRNGSINGSIDVGVSDGADVMASGNQAEDAEQEEAKTLMHVNRAWISEHVNVESR